MPKKELGQHWLHDRQILTVIADSADITAQDVVLEIGPGLGTLTSELLRQASSVTAVEFDSELAAKLPGQFPGKRLTVIHQDILSFDFTVLPKNYKVVANVPYYITSKIIQRLSETDNPPRSAALLVQKEVAERITAQPGEMSVMSIATQVFFEASLGVLVTRDYFTPPPEVDSQLVLLSRRDEPLVSSQEQPKFFRIVRAGFSERRKKLRSSLAGGLQLGKDEVDRLLSQAQVAPESRAQELSIAQWQQIMRVTLAS